MAIVSIKEIAPKKSIAASCTHPALRQALHHVVQGLGNSLWLVGGTALAGYYAAHRRSDDLDLFAKDAVTHAAAIHATRQLSTLGAVVSNERRTPGYYRAEVHLDDYALTIDVVLDEHLHAVGTSVTTHDGVTIPTISTLFAMKAATLVSRCSEKDLFDLWWIDTQVQKLDAAMLIEAGSTLDGGLTTETLLIGLHGARLRPEACGFVVGGKKGLAHAYRVITQFRTRLVKAILAYQSNEAAPPDIAKLAAVVKAQRRLR